MQTSRKPQCVLDASVVIDLYAGGVLAKLFDLPYQFVAPDMIITELNDPRGVVVETMGLSSRRLSMEQLSEVMTHLTANPRLSSRDVQAFIMARDEKAMLLTGDASLRRLAEERDVTVHGVLWLLDEMVAHGVLTPREALASLHHMLDEGSRLPPDECQQRFERWENTT